MLGRGQRAREQRPARFTSFAIKLVYEGLRRSKVANCDLRARDPHFLLAKRGDNRANDGGVLKLGDGEALPARVLQRCSDQVAFGAVQDEETVLITLGGAVERLRLDLIRVSAR
jgi:hypothetical protein